MLFWAIKRSNIDLAKHASTCMWANLLCLCTPSMGSILGVDCMADVVAGPAADKEESSHRVLLLASQGCLGGAEEHTGDQAMDSRAVKSLWCLFGSLMMIVIFGKTVDEM